MAHERFLRNLKLIVSVATATCISAGWAGAATKEKVIYSFTDGSDGGIPSSALILDNAGNLYGEADGGMGGYGVVFELRPGSSGRWRKTTFYAFGDDGINGGDPAGGLARAESGTLYGVTGYFGANSSGTVFQLPTVSLTNPTIYNFLEGSGQASGLVLDHAGNLYGTTEDGGPHDVGTVFELTHTFGGWNYEVLHNFETTETDGYYPFGRLIIDAAGNLYGTTYEGGVYGVGTVFELTNTGDGWTESVLYNFTGGDNGSGPLAGVIFDRGGHLYGTTLLGGTDNAGTVYQLTPHQGYWTFRVIYSFTGAQDGGSPYYGSLTVDSAGELYGTTRYGGQLQYGTVFRLAQEQPGAWRETVLHSFIGGNDGENPIYGVTLDSAGHLYGTTPFGGGDGWGIAFECIR
jgi:uncharacterized repeat protein (TIGR03803 family)